MLNTVHLYAAEACTFPVHFIFYVDKSKNCVEDRRAQQSGPKSQRSSLTKLRTESRFLIFALVFLLHYGLQDTVTYMGHFVKCYLKTEKKQNLKSY